MTEYKKDPSEIGIAWKKEKNGTKFYSGFITIDGKELPIVMFRNERKQPGSKAPDLRIMLSNAPARQAPAAPAAKPAPQRSTGRTPVRQTPPPAPPAQPAQEETDDTL